MRAEALTAARDVIGDAGRLGDVTMTTYDDGEGDTGDYEEKEADSHRQHDD